MSEIEKIGLNPSVVKALNDCGIATLYDLRSCTFADLMRVDGLGRKAADQIGEYLWPGTSKEGRELASVIHKQIKDFDQSERCAILNMLLDLEKLTPHPHSSTG